MKIINCVLSVFIMSTICCQIRSPEMNSSFISYEDLKYSIDNVIVSDEKKLNEYEIINLKEYINNFSKDEFYKLKNQSKEKNVSKEFYILEYREGEVVTMKMHYIVFGEKNNAHFYIEKDDKIIKKNIRKTDIKKIFVTPIENKNYQDVIIISQIVNKKIISNLGNSNDVLNEIL